jgi:hypothetical protein
VSQVKKVMAMSQIAGDSCADENSEGRDNCQQSIDSSDQIECESGGSDHG